MLSQVLFMHCWTVVFISVIDGITGLIAHAGLAAATAAAEETIVVPPGGLIEWNGRDNLWKGYLYAEWIRNPFWRILFGNSWNSFWDVIFWELESSSICIVFRYARVDERKQMSDTCIKDFILYTCTFWIILSMCISTNYTIDRYVWIECYPLWILF